MLGFATVAITGALVFYTIGFFAERQSGTLKLSHIVLFYLGFTCDTTGTACMSFIAQNGSQNPVHATTGALAIILMIVHAVWEPLCIPRKILQRSLASIVSVLEFGLCGLCLTFAACSWEYRLLP